MDGNNQNNQNPATNQNTDTNGANGGAVNQTIDYDKIQQILDGTLNAKTDTVLKSYFKQQGLSQEDAERAIADFKTRQKENAPDVDSLNATIKAKDDKIAALEAEIAQRDLSDATKALADELKFDAKYTALILKNANTKEVHKEDGTIDAEKLKKAINAFLEEVPDLKKSTTKNNRAFKPDNVGNPKPANNTNNNNANKPKTSRGMIAELFQ
jgi:hypothetical protein